MKHIILLCSLICTNVYAQGYFTYIHDTACGEYSWNGVIYDSSGVYTNSYVDISGVDSTVSLNLIVFQDSSVTYVESCDSAEWNGAWYYNDTVVSTSGLYSVNTFGGGTTYTESSNEGNIWYFGSNAGLDFNSGSPVALNDGQLNTDEGCATIADVSGNLLFYTDGSTVYNKNHEVMQNGLGLLGNSSSSQSAIILKKPNSNSIYYIFTADGWSGTQGGLNYSEVDMDLEGGLGAITANKNILLMPQTCEKVTAIKHQNESDFWVISRAENSNSYSTFLVTSNGVDLVPIVTNIGDVYSGTGGYMKGSPNGNRLAVANYFINNTFDLFDFDNSTGIMSNLSSISTPNDAMVYGIEFSPNNDIIYVATWPYGLYQFDLLGGSASSIINSVVDLNGLNNSIGLQIGPDDKIYITENGFSSLGVIENPNVLGAGCNYTAGAVSLGSGVSHLGLPTFFSSVFNTTTTLPTSCDSTATAIIRINSSSSSILDTSVCESFYWNDSLYTSSGLYTFSSSNSLGCDSIAKLNLTIYNTTYNEDYQFHCDSYTWIDGNTYLAANNTATHIITNSLGCDSVITLKLNMPENNLIIPNTFTPNYDRKNEVFKIYSKSNVKDFEVWVYNKWGQEIFYSNEIDEGWNGFFKGALCPIGVYVYKLSYKCLGQQIIDTGSFFLMM